MTDAPPPYPGINGYSATAPYMGAGGFVNPPTSGGSGNSMGASVLQTGYVDPNNPQMAYLPQVNSNLLIHRSFRDHS